MMKSPLGFTKITGDIDGITSVSINTKKNYQILFQKIC